VRAQLLAFAAAALAVPAAWEAVDVGAAAVRRAGSLVAPLRGQREPRGGERRRLIAVASLTALAGGWLLTGPVLAFAAALATPVVMHQWLATQDRRRRAHLAAAAPAVARAIADSLAGGSSIRAAVAGAHAGVIDAVARNELRALGRTLELGAPTEQVIDHLREIADDRAYEAIVAAILLQREAGGDLAGLLRRLAATLEADARADHDARATTAQARFSAGLVAWLPAVAAVIAELAAPGSVRAVLATPLSAMLTAVAIGLQLLGWFVIRRVSAVR
jgi:tight adherence protein B